MKDVENEEEEKKQEEVKESVKKGPVIDEDGFEVVTQ